MKHITDMKNRGHRAYVNVDIGAMEKKAQQLPEDGVPLEIIRSLGHDNHLDKVNIQKNAATVDKATNDLNEVARNLARQAPNAVTMEKTSTDEVDVNYLHHNALH